MKCPHCGYHEDRVIETRVQKEGDIRRRRECLSCKERFNTLESVTVHYPHIVKKDGRREPFSKEKLRRGIQIACKKRPVSLPQIEGVVGRIANWAQGKAKKELGALQLGQKVIEELKTLDDVAYVRFASVYKTFGDVQEFFQTLKSDANSKASKQQT